MDVDDYHRKTSSAATARQLEIRANKQAELFVDAYYSVYDSQKRADKLPEFYRPDVRVVWNGNAITNLSALASQLLSRLSFSKHDIQSFDAHVIPGSIMPPSVLPSLSISVSGQVIFSSRPFPASFRMPDPKDVSPNQNPTDAQQALAGLPRVFSQTFILVPSPNITEPTSTPSVTHYSIVADCFRFVG